MYVSGIPCPDCALIIMQSGIARLVYLDESTPELKLARSDDTMWDDYGIEIERVAYRDDLWEELYGELDNEREILKTRAQYGSAETP